MTLGLAVGAGDIAAVAVVEAIDMGAGAKSKGWLVAMRCQCRGRGLLRCNSFRAQLLLRLRLGVRTLIDARVVVSGPGGRGRAPGKHVRVCRISYSAPFRSPCFA